MLYIFSCNWLFSTIRENMHSGKITFIVPYRLRGNYIKSVYLNPHEIADFLKFVKIYTHENIYVYSSIKTHFLLLVG